MGMDCLWFRRLEFDDGYADVSCMYGTLRGIGCSEEEAESMPFSTVHELPNWGTDRGIGFVTLSEEREEAGWRAALDDG
jgi:hypothetical protein